MRRDILTKLKKCNPVCTGNTVGITDIRNLLASSLVIAMYNGSLAHILLIYEKVRKFVFYLSCKYTDWNPRRSLLQLAVFAGNGSEISNLQNSYPEILNHMMADDAAMVMVSATITPFHIRGS